MELILLTGLLEALTTFLDQEEKLGFLQQDIVDKLLAIESMLNEVLFGMTHEQVEMPSHNREHQELMYVPFLDADDDEFTHKAHHEMEL